MNLRGLSLLLLLLLGYSLELFLNWIGLLRLNKLGVLELLYLLHQFELTVLN